MSIKRVFQKHIAERAGVHVTTVSLALRDDPCLPKSTRERIQNLAKEMGYHPDPMLSALTVYRRNAQRPHHQGTLAWLNATKRDTIAYGDSFRSYRRGAEARCAELGYVLEEFRLDELPLARLARILQARNITGVLLPPQPRRLSHLNFEWDSFSAVSFGFTLARPRLHLVTNAQYQSTRTAVRAMRSCGYRRIGFATTYDNELRTDQNLSSGYLAEQRLGKKAKIPVFVYNDVKETLRKTFLKGFSKWISVHQPDAILAFDDEIPQSLERLGISAETCGYASMSLTQPGGPFAGIYQNDEKIGRTAVDFLVDMIHRGERGVPQIPLRILVEGTWINGPSLPRSMSKISKLGKKDPTSPS